MHNRALALFGLLLLALPAALGAQQAALSQPGRGLLGDHKYKQGEDIQLYANKVGPFQNPT